MRTPTMSLSLRIAYLLPLVGISPACPGASGSEQPAVTVSAAGDDAPVQAAGEPAAPTPEPVDAPPARRAASGLDLGMSFEPFEVQALVEDQANCRVCILREAGTRVLLTHGSLEDPKYVELLLDLQALSRRYRDPGFAILALSNDAPELAKMRAETLRELRRLELDIYRVAEGDASWAEHYRVTSPYTVMFADGSGEVKFTAVDPEPLDELDAAIRASGLEVEMLDAPAD